MSPATSSTDSESTSSGVLISQNDNDSETESHGSINKLANMRLSDVPIASIERGTSTTEGLDISDGRRHSRTPSVSLSPPLGQSDSDPLRRTSPGRDCAGIDGRLGMSQVADAINSIAAESGAPDLLLRPKRPSIRNNTPRRGRRSNSHLDKIPHNVADEELPQDRFHDPTFQSAISEARRIMSELAGVISSSSLANAPDSTIRRLFIDAQRLSQFRCQSTRKVGFVGDSGVGKSSLLNSLLDFKGLARTSNSGEACTCVATEYHYHDSNDFIVDVEWFSEDEMAVQISELLRSYRQIHLYGADIDPKERQDLEDRANVARDTFQAMFRGRLGDEEVLVLPSESTVLETLKSWVAEFMMSSTSGREEVKTIEECSKFLARLTSEESTNQQAAKWPFIRKINVFSKAHILSKGLVLVDLPGLRDVNSARRNITERYLLECDEIFAICNIGRAITDRSVVGVFELATKAKKSHVGIICTKSDEIQPEEAIRDWRGERARRIQNFMDRIATDQREVAEMQTDLADYATDGELSDGELQDLADLTRHCEQVKKRLELHQFELKSYLIDTRNADIRQTLDSLFRNKIPGNNFQAFCTSNTVYWEHRESAKEAAMPHLHLSGIITLRKYCISIIASEQLRVATKYIQHDIQALLEDVNLWVQSGAGSVNAEQKAAIRETLSTLEARLNRELMGNSSDVNTIARFCNRTFETVIRDAQRVPEWTRGAKDASNVWAQWAHPTYSAFCRNFGDYYSPLEHVGSHNWNEEAIEKMAGDLSTPWENLVSTLARDFDGRERRIQELMDWVIDYLDTELPESSESASTLKRAMSSRQSLLLADVEQAFEKSNAELSLLRTNALSGLRTSLIGELMESSYLACIYESGRGSHARRKAIINGKLHSEATFELLQTRIRHRFKAIVESFQSDLQTIVGTHLAIIKNTLDIVRSENIALESEQEPEFRARIEIMAAIIKGELGRIQEAIANERDEEIGPAGIKVSLPRDLHTI